MITTKPKDIDAYIAGFPKETQVRLKKVRATVKKVAPSAVEIISYGMPAYKLNGKLLLYFAAFKNHIGFYPYPSVTGAFKKELSLYKTGKGSVQFPLDKPMPIDLITNMVKFRVEENIKKIVLKKEPRKPVTIKVTKQTKEDPSAKITKSSEPEKVDEFISKLKHPMVNIVKELRKIILNADKTIGEEISWNAPSFFYTGEMKPFKPKEYKRFIVVFNLFKKDCVRLIFLRGAQVKDSSRFLEGDYTDGRRLAMFYNMKDIKAKEKILQKTIKQLLKTIDK